MATKINRSCNIDLKTKQSFIQQVETILQENGCLDILNWDGPSVNIDLDKLTKELSDLISQQPANRDEYIGAVKEVIGDRGEVNSPLLIESITEEIKRRGVSHNQLILTSLDARNGAWKPYLTHTSAFNRMLKSFKLNMLGAVYVDRKRGICVMNDRDTEKAIERYKIQLFNDLIRYVNLHNPKRSDLILLKENGKGKNADHITAELYTEVMTRDNILGEFLNKVQSGEIVLYDSNDPNKETENERIFNTLFILNNFDVLVQKYFDKVITITPSFFGSVESGITDKYKRGLKGLQNALWGAESLEAKEVRSSISNLAKTIISTIERTDYQGNIKPGEYLNENDLFIISSVLKRLEVEYFVNNPNTQIAFLKNPKEALRVLIESAKSSNDKKILEPLRKYLYDDSDSTRKSISSIYKKTIENSKSGSNGNVSLIPDVEALLAYEVLKTVPVIYTSYKEDRTTDVADLVGAYFAPAKIKDALTNGLHIVLANSQNFPEFSTNSSGIGTFSLKINDKIVTASSLTGNLQNAKDFLEDFTIKRDFMLLTGTPLNEEYIKAIQDKENITQLSDIATRIFNYLNEAAATLQNVNKDTTDLDNYTKIQNSVQKWITSPDRMTSYYAVSKAAILISGSKPITEIKSHSGNSIPIYRLNSAGFDDSYFMQHYLELFTLLKTKYGEKAVASDDNFIIANSQILTNVNNEEYSSSTGIRLEAYNEDSSEQASHFKVSESVIASFVGDYVGLMMDKGIFGTLVMTYSDKVSIILKLFNAKAPLEVIRNGFIVSSKKGKVQNHDAITLQNISVTDLAEMYRTTQMKYWNGLCGRMLTDWNDFIPYLNQLYGTEFIPVSDWNSLEELLQGINTLAKNNNKKSSNILQEVVYFAEHNTLGIPRKHLELTANKHYRSTKGQLHINNDLKRMQESFSSVSNFAKFKHEYEMEFIKKFDKYFPLTDLVAMIPKQYSYAEVCKKLLSKEELRSGEFKSDRALAEKMGTSVYREVTVGDHKEKVLNPLVEKYLLLTNMMKDSYLGLTVKHPYIHDIKKIPETKEIKDLKKRIAQDEKNPDIDPVILAEEKRQLNALILREMPKQEADECVKAAMKRMVILPGTLENYSQGLLNGIPSHYNIAIIEDEVQDVQNFKGQRDKMKVYDGGALGNPFSSILEENSLIAKGIRGTKKPIGMYSGDGFSMLFKYAQFPFTNRKILDSVRSENSLLNLMKKMNSVIFQLNGIFVDQFGKPYVDFLGNHVKCDLSKNMFGTTISAQTMNNGKPIFYAQGGKYYKVTSFTSTGNGLYQIFRREVDSNGNVIGENDGSQVRPIETLYQLWEMFGGYQSMELKNGELVPSEDSIKIVTNYINNIGFQIKEDSNDPTQDNYMQPLKHAMIHMVASAGCVKNGGTNINDVSQWHSEFNENASVLEQNGLSYIRIKTSGFGTQMDANHEADDAELTEMSQVITSLAANGVMTKEAEEAYNAIASIIKESLIETVGNLEDISKDKLDKVLKKMSIDLVHSLSDTDRISTAHAAQEVLTRDGYSILPMSSPNFFGLLTSSVLSKLSSSSIRRKYAGLTTILHPSAKIITVYDINGKTFSHSAALKGGRQLFKSELKNSSFTEDQIADLYLAYTTLSDDDAKLEFFDIIRNRKYLASPEDLKLYDKVTLGESEVLVLDTKGKLESAKLSSNTYKVLPNDAALINFIRGRYLEMRIPANEVNLYDWVIDNGKKVYIDDFDKFEKYYNEPSGFITKVLNKPRDLRPVTITYKVADKQVNIFMSEPVIMSVDFEKIMDGKPLSNSEDTNKLKLQRLAEFFNYVFNENPKTLGNNTTFIKAINGDLNSEKACRKYLQRLRQRNFELLDLNLIFDFNKPFKEMLAGIDLKDRIRSLQDIKVDNYIPVSNVNIDEAEIVMPKVFNTKQNIGDKALHEIDLEHFKKLIYNQTSKDPQANIQIVTPKLTYGIIIGDYTKFDLGEPVTGIIDGVKIDENGKALYNVPESCVVFEKTVFGDKQITFVVDPSSDVYNSVNSIVHSIHDKTFVNLHRNLDQIEKLIPSLAKILKKENNITYLKNIYRKVEKGEFTAVESALSNMVNVVSQAMYSSSVLANHLISARVPSQALQSFMSMKIVALTDDEANNAYVSIWLPWLQGSK